MDKDVTDTVRCAHERSCTSVRVRKVQCILDATVARRSGSRIRVVEQSFSVISLYRSRPQLLCRINAIMYCINTLLMAPVGAIVISIYRYISIYRDGDGAKRRHLAAPFQRHSCQFFAGS